MCPAPSASRMRHRRSRGALRWQPFRRIRRLFAAPNVELRAGGEGRALVANGGALFSFGANPTGTAKLHARQLDLDNIAVPPDVAPDTPRPSAAQWLAAARRLLERSALPDMQWTAETNIDAVTTGGLTLTDAAARLEARPGVPTHLVASIAGPEGTQAGLDGTMEGGAAPAFKGEANFATRNLGTVAGWVDPFWPGASDWVGRGLAGRAVAFNGTIDVSKAGASARAAALSLGGTTLSGTLSLTAAAGDERTRLFADLNADVLDGGQWPDLEPLAALADPLDLSIALRSDAVRLARSDTGASETGRVSMHLTKKDRVFALDQFAVSGIEGTTVSGSASLDAERKLRADGRVVAKNPVPLANLVRQLIPGGIADAFASRAAALAPLDVGFDAEAALDDHGAVLPTKLSADGTAGATRFTGSVAPALKGGDTSDIEVSLTLDAPDATQVLQQAGWHAAGQFGALHVEVRAHGDPSAALDSSVSATVPGAKLAFDGKIGQAAGQGRFAANGDDVTPWLRLAGIDRTPVERAWTAAADLAWTDQSVTAAKLTAHVGGSAVAGDIAYAWPAAESGGAATLSGKLAIDALGLPTLAAIGLGQPRTTTSGMAQLWSGQPFGPAPTLPAAEVSLRIGALDLWPSITAREAAMQLSLRSGALTLTDITGHVLGGTAGGTLTFRRNGPAASLTGRVALDGIGVRLPSLSGRLSGTLDIAGTGTNPAAVIGSLGGDGTLTLAEATLPRLDPGALGRVASDFNRDDAVIEDAPVRAALDKALDRGALPLGPVNAAATVAAGSLRVAIPKTVLPDASLTGDVAFDFETLALTFKTTVVAAELPREWKGDPPQLSVTWKGPLDAPSRDLDAGAFLNGLAARAIAREQERIELMKDDLRERAFFARRLKQIEAEQQAARDAAQIQKIVPQPPRPGDIRLPKPPEVVPPIIPLAPKTPDTGENQDGISKFLNALTPSPKTKPVSTRPLELSPGSRPAAQVAPAAPTQDPGQEGRY